MNRFVQPKREKAALSAAITRVNAVSKGRTYPPMTMENGQVIEPWLVSLVATQPFLKGVKDGIEKDRENMKELKYREEVRKRKEKR